MLPSGYTTVDLSNPFPNAAIYWCAETDSTMDDALAAWQGAEGSSAAGHPVHGSAWIADFQRRGRGRKPGTMWAAMAAENVLMTTLLSRGHATLPLSFLPLVCGLAVCRAIGELVGDGGLEAAVGEHAAAGDSAAGRPELKWPNDVLIRGRKVAGVLCDHRGSATFVGMGINVNQTEFDEAEAANATSLRIAYGMHVDRKRVVREVLSALAAVLDDRTAAAQCEARLYAKNREVEIIDAGLRGRLEGLAEDGAILLRDAGGVTQRCYSGQLRAVGAV